MSGFHDRPEVLTYKYREEQRQQGILPHVIAKIQNSEGKKVWAIYGVDDRRILGLPGFDVWNEQPSDATPAWVVASTMKNRGLTLKRVDIKVLPLESDERAKIIHRPVTAITPYRLTERVYYPALATSRYEGTLPPGERYGMRLVPVQELAEALTERIERERLIAPLLTQLMLEREVLSMQSVDGLRASVS